MKKRTETTCLLLILAFCAGCEWDFPLSDPDTAVDDEQLLGAWKLVTTYSYTSGTEFTRTTPGKNELSILTLMDGKGANSIPGQDALPKNIIILSIVEIHRPVRPGTPRPGKQSQFAWVTKIGDRTYLNVGSAREDTPSGAESDRAYSVVKYTVSDDKFIIYALNKTARKRITTFLGDFYSAKTFIKQLTAGEPDDWQPTLEFTRIK